MNLKQIVQAEIYDQDNILRGLVDKLTLDGRKTTEIEHNTLGQVGMLKMPGRPLQAVTGKVEIGHVDEVLDRRMANPTTRHNWQLHQKVDVFDEEGYSLTKSHTLVHHIKWHFLEDDGVTSELGEKAGMEYTITIPFLRQYVLGQDTPIFFLDVFKDIYEVNGQRVWAE